MAGGRLIPDGAVIACTACDWSSADLSARHECPNDPKVLQAKLEQAERDVKEVQAAREWIANKTGVGGGLRPLSFLISSHEYMAQERAAAQAQRNAAESALAESRVANQAWMAQHARLESALAAAQGALRDLLREDTGGDDPDHWATPTEQRARAVLAAESGKPGGEARETHEQRIARGDAIQAFNEEQEANLFACITPGCGGGTRYSGDYCPSCREPRAAPPALPAEPGWEAPSLAELFMGYARENHAMSAASPEGTWNRAFYAGRGNAFLAAADRVPHAPALPAELSGKIAEPGEAKKEEGT